MSLTTRSLVKERLEIASTTWDALIDTIVLGVDGIVNAFLGYTVESTTYSSEKHDGDGLSSIVMLDNFYVTAVSSCTVDGVAQTEGNEADFVIKKFGLVFATPPPKKRDVVVVSYTAGYTTVPAVIREAALEIAAHLYQHRDQAVLAETEGFVKYENDITMRGILTRINAYRLRM
jgi:hypothetical protein